MFEPNRTAAMGRRAWAASLSLAAVAVLTACGGGGGGGTTTPTTPTTPTAPSNPTTGDYNPSAALAAIYTGGITNARVQARLADGSQTISQVYTLTPGPDAVFDGATRKTVSKVVLSSDGNNSLTETRTVYYSTGPFAFNGAAGNDGSRALTSVVAALPTGANVGDSGDFYTGANYGSNGALEATSSVRWAIEADGSTDGNSAFLCLNITNTPRVNGVAGTPVTGKECYRITKSGQFLGMRVVLNYTPRSGVSEVLDMRPPT